MKRLIKIGVRALSLVFISIMALILLSNLYLLIAKKVTGRQDVTVFGYTSAVVLTGSMESAISPNDMVIVHQQAEYEVYDVVMYRGNSSTVTHRIMELKENGYVTKGDANNTDDGEIPKERVIGKVVFVIPNIGAVLSFLQSPLGMLLLVVVLFLLIELPSLVKRKDSRQASEKGETSDH